MSLREKIRIKIEEIYPLVMTFLESPVPENPYGLMEGKTGAAFFLHQYALHHPDKKKQCYKKINSIIENAFDYIGETPGIRTSYCDGIIGILWLAQFLKNEKVIELDDEDISMDIVQELNEYSLSQSTDQGNCDLLHGGFGFWAFLLESKNMPGKEKYIRDQLDALAKIKIDAPYGYNWKIDLTIFQKENKIKADVDASTSTHLGMAHGITFILALLAKTKMQGFFEEETEYLLHKGLEHIRSLKMNSNSLYTYPMIVINGKPSNDGRLAWCNGDLGIAGVFLLAWKATGREDYRTEALEILRSASKLTVEDAGAVDAGLCHGTAGIAALFKRFYIETKDVQLKTAHDNWIAATLEMATFTDGYAGYKTYSSASYGGPRKEYGFLSGISGIGTSLLSSLSEEPVAWDRVLQIC